MANYLFYFFRLFCILKCVYSIIYITLGAYCVSFQSADENGDNSGCELESSLEERIEELLHRLRIEAAVVAGAKNVIRILQNNKVPDKKALQEVSGTNSVFGDFGFSVVICFVCSTF